MTPTTQSPETRARELLERLFEHNGIYQEFCFDHRAELTTLITKADALDWLEENVTDVHSIESAPIKWELANDVEGFSIIGKGVTLLSAITKAMKGRE